MKELWKSISGWPYEVSDKGRIRREDNKRLRRPAPNSRGYPQIMLCKGHKTSTVHKLVLEAFVGPRPKGKEANHKDGNKLNNCLENLEWVSRSENMLHAFSLNLYPPRITLGSRNPCAKLDEEDVLKIRELYHHKELSQYALARLFNVSQSSIYLIVNRKRWRHVGPFDDNSGKGA